MSLRKQLAATAKASRFTHGPRRIWWSLHHAGMTVSKKVIRRLMAQDHIPMHGSSMGQLQGKLAPAPPILPQRDFYAYSPCQL